MKARFIDAAEMELDKAVAYYEKRRRGLGRCFLLEVADAVALIEEFPEAWPYVTDLDRPCRVKRFPFRVVYFSDGADTVVIAVAHFKRRLRCWRNRVRN